ncbi:hypothetical protein M9Y10_026418 [Tritrichomonas musculus]|uniref:MHD1 domain-containing protein n=1 Tax=Tritrichomonas musculus TaxID=1915356 RepID=A0ABR2H8V7_9EUKA
MIDQFSNLIQLSKECSDLEELTKSITEVDALKEGVTKFDFTRINLSNNQMKVLFNDNTNSLIRQIIDQSSGTFSTFGRDLIEKEFSRNPDFLFLLEYFSKFNDLSQPINFNQISSENLDPLSYFLFVQQIFDSISTIPNDMNDDQKALSDIIKYITLHTKSLSLLGNMAGLNNEILRISKNVQGANLQILKPIFQDCFIKSIVHKNRISKDSINNSAKTLLKQSGAEESMTTKLDNERENYYTLLPILTSLIYYKNYLKNDNQNKFNPYGQIKGEIINSTKTKTNFMIEKVGQLLTRGKTPSGIYALRLTVIWEKAFKGTRLSNASFIEITYQNSKKTYEINKDEEGSFFEIVLPSFSKSDDKVDISLLYVKEKFNDTIRKNVPADGIGTLVTFSFPLKTDNNSKLKTAKPKARSSSMIIESDDGFIVEFKRGDTALSTKCGTVKVNSKFYEFKDDGVPEILENNVYLSKSGNGGFSDDFQMKQFLDFLTTNLVNQWLSQTSMSIYPPQEAYIGLIEFSMRYSIPASTIYLLISKKLLNAWCHAESYLNAFTAMFITAHVCMTNNQKRTKSMFLNKIEEDLYGSLYEYLAENVPIYLIQHLSRSGLYQNHGLAPLLMLLSFIVPEEGIDSYVDQLIKSSHKSIIRIIASYLRPIYLESGEKNSEKMTNELGSFLNFVNSKSSSSKHNAFDSLIKNDSEIDFTEFDPSTITFSIKSLADTIDILNKRTQQLKKFNEDNSLPSFLSIQWDKIEGDLCQLTLLLVNLFVCILKEKFGDDQSIFKFIFSYRDLHDFFMKSSNKDIIESEIRTDEFSPFKLFLNVVLDWISRIGEQMSIWTTKAVNIDTFEIDDKKLKTSSSPKDMFEVFRQSFTFIYSLHWEDPSIEVFVYTFLSLCGSCLRNFIETLTFRMLSYFPLEVIQESQIEDLQHYLEDLESTNTNIKPKKEKHKDKERRESESSSNVTTEPKITTRNIFVIINNFINLKLMWNGFLVHVKKMFPSLFPEENKNRRISLSSADNSSSLLASSNVIELPPNVMDPVPKITGITNSIPTLFSLMTSHLVTDTVSPHLWIKNSAVKQVFVKNASKYILNPDFFQTCSPIYASIYDTILNYIKERIDDINATTCMKYYKTMIISFLFGLDSGMMNLLILKKKKSDPIKNKRLIPILNFIHDLYKEIYQYVLDTAIDNVFASDEKLESYTPHSDFMFNHVQDDPEQLIDLVSKNCSQDVINASNEKDPQFLNALCIFIIVASQNNDKRHSVTSWVQENKEHFKKKRFYPPKYK